jgi:hypothetical protein
MASIYYLKLRVNNMQSLLGPSSRCVWYFCTSSLSYSILQGAQKLSERSGSQKYGAFSDFFCVINSYFTFLRINPMGLFVVNLHLGGDGFILVEERENHRPPSCKVVTLMNLGTDWGCLKANYNRTFLAPNVTKELIENLPVIVTLPFAVRSGSLFIKLIRSPTYSLVKDGQDKKGDALMKTTFTHAHND